MSEITNRQSYQYFPQGPLRFYDLNGNSNLSEIDLSVFWEDKKGNLTLLQLVEGDTLSIKILFRKKHHGHPAERVKDTYKADMSNPFPFSPNPLCI